MNQQPLQTIQTGFILTILSIGLVAWFFLFMMPVLNTLLDELNQGKTPTIELHTSINAEPRSC